MLPKQSRLPRDQFHIAGYQTIKTPFFSLKFKKNKTGSARIGVVGGKSIHKTAVRRNFWKRQVKANFSKFAKSQDDFLIILLPGVNKLTKKAFQNEALGAIARLKK